MFYDQNHWRHPLCQQSYFVSILWRKVSKLCKFPDGHWSRRSPLYCISDLLVLREQLRRIRIMRCKTSSMILMPFTCVPWYSGYYQASYIFIRCSNLWLATRPGLQIYLYIVIFVTVFRSNIKIHLRQCKGLQDKWVRCSYTAAAVVNISQIPFRNLFLCNTV
jgi:hypothetical protein